MGGTQGEAEGTLAVSLDKRCKGAGIMMSALGHVPEALASIALALTASRTREESD